MQVKQRASEEIFASGKYYEASLTAAVVCVAQGLHEIPERGDRLIAATAMALTCR